MDHNEVLRLDWDVRVESKLDGVMLLGLAVGDVVAALFARP
jgi:hypothetical protein